MAEGRVPLRSALMAVGIAAAAAVALLALWVAAQVLLLLFGAVLLAILLRSFSDALARRTPLSPTAAHALVVLGVLLLAGLTVWLAGPMIATQIDDFFRQLPEAARRIDQFLERWGWGEGILTREGGLLQRLEDPETLADLAPALFGWTLRGLAAILIIFFVAVYLSWNPALYVRGAVRLVPPARRARAGEIIADLGHTLRLWLLTRLASMAAVGILTTVALSVIGLPLPGLLGLQAALLTFVPYVGPIAATIPIVLAALFERPETLIYAVVVYTMIQSTEGFLIMPLAQKRIVHVPPALVLVSEVLMGAWFGALGIAMATPLAAALRRLVQLAYVEDVLGDRVDPDEAEES